MSILADEEYSSCVAAKHLLWDMELCESNSKGGNTKTDRKTKPTKSAGQEL
jgi:hypothetical protein